MEPNVPIAKKMWKLIRVVLFMIRKGVSKSKLMLDLNILLKRGKNLIFHHGGGGGDGGQRKEYEFSCSNTPANYHHFFPSKKKHRSADDDMAAVRAVLEILNAGAGEENGTMCENLTEPSTPYLLPGFGRTPLRITGSPLCLTEKDGDSSHVDKAAEEFIQKVRRDLRKQKKIIDCN